MSLRSIPRRAAVPAVLGVLLLATAGCTLSAHSSTAKAAATPAAQVLPSNALVPAAIEEAAAAAQQLLPLVGSWDYRYLARDEATAVSASTGAFADQIRTVFDTTLKPRSLADKAVTKLEVQAIGVTGVASGKVQALALTTQTLTTSQAQSPAKNPSAVQVSVTPSAGHWHLTNVVTVTPTSDAPAPDLTWLPEPARAAAAAGRVCVRAAFTLRNAHRGADERAGLDCTTGRARTLLQDSYAALPSQSADRVAHQPLIGVSNATADTVYLVVAGGSEPSGSYRLIVKMQLVAGHWLIAETQDVGTA